MTASTTSVTGAIGAIGAISVISVIGIGEDGLDGLNPAAVALIEAAEILVGGARHLAKIPPGAARRLDWSAGFDATLDILDAHQDRRIVVLASGDPLQFGVGATLIRRFGGERVFVWPAPGAVSLTCARMGWSVPDITVVTIHGRAIENLHLHLVPNARLVVLARDGDSAHEVAKLLHGKGFGPSPMTVLERIGGAGEQRLTGVAESWSHGRTADLATLAIECVAGPHAKPWSRLAGLADAAYEHDGQLTKREVRAVTLARLAPLPGETLWDIGAGAGSVAIEWMRTDPGCRAVAVERDPQRAARIARNAANLGVGALNVVIDDADTALTNMSGSPDAVFVGGGLSVPGLLERAWARVKPGGRLVANAVTIEGGAQLAALKHRHGGDLVQIAIAREDTRSKAQTVFQPLRTVTQYLAFKPVREKP